MSGQMDSDMQVSEPSAKYMVKAEEYQQPEAGIIPHEWTVKRLGEIVTFQRGFDLPHRNRKSGDYPIVTSSGFEEFHNEYRAKAPGVVTGRYGTIGQVFLVATDYWPLNTTLYVRDFHGNDPNFISHLLRTVDFHSHSGKSGVPGVNRNDLHEIKTAYPADIAEQQAIATALSDTDALIDALEQLLAKKRQVKQGAMRELLTGEKRLAGFHGEWAIKILGDCLSNPPEYGINAPAVDFSDQLPTYIRITDITDDGEFRPNPKVSVKTHNLEQYTLKQGDILFTRTGASVGKSYLYTKKDGPLIFAGFLIRVRAKQEELLPEFLFALTKTENYWKWVTVMSMRSGQPGINGNEYKQLPIPVPSIEEQAAIAAILSDMDTDITELETRLGKVRQVKQGMMRELLTGRTRLA